MAIDTDVQSFAEENANITDCNTKYVQLAPLVANPSLNSSYNNKIPVRRSGTWSIEGEEAYNGYYQDFGNISGEVVLTMNGDSCRTAMLATVTGNTFITGFGTNFVAGVVYTLFVKQDAVGGFSVRWPYGASILNQVGADPNQITAVYVVKLPNGKIFVKCEAFQNTVEIGSVLAEIEKPLILYPTQEDAVSRSFEWKKSEPLFYGAVLSSVSSDWEVAKDELFSELIFSSYNNLVEVFSLLVRVQWVGFSYFRTRYNGSIDGLPSSSLWSLTFSRFFGNTTEKDLPIFGKLSVVEITKVLDLAENVGVAVAGSSGGLFTIASDGSWTFDPGGDFALLEGSETADTSVTYYASDGLGEASATLTVTVSATAGDPLWSNVVLCLNAAGADNSTTIIDETGKTPSIVNGDTKIRTILGYNSIYLDGSGDYMRFAANGTDFDFSNGSFCVEAWLYLNTIAGNLFTQRTGSNANGILFGFHSNQVSLQLGNGSSWFYSPANFNLGVGTNTLFHLALIRDGNTIRVCRNGTQIHSGTTTGTIGAAGLPANIGWDPGNVGMSYYPLSGHIKGFRITKGSPRYIGTSFTPDAAPFLT